MERYNHQKIEKKWQRIWEKKKIYQPNLRHAKKPFYNLMMFPYPSAEGLHVGNMYAFTGSDIYGRFKRMQGFDVFEPIGLDGFGIHSENYALKIGEHPAKVAKRTERNFYRQLKATGNGYAWDNKIETYEPDYYKWTQWIFIQMFKKGLAYRKKAPVNWCPSCKTVLSDEQVEGEVCERCKNKVEVRELKQWFFKITAYTQRLLRNLDWIDWSLRVKEMQKNWIGKSEGLEIKFKVQPHTRDVVSVRGRSLRFKAKDLEVFTTRPDTIYGVTFMAISPNHQLVRNANTDHAAASSILANLKALHPLTGEKLPIYVADYVVGEYGTAAVMGVPAYDERDLAFAKQNKIPVKKVPLENMKKIIKKLLKIGVAKRKINYKLRDWCISRQRYWGPPIPMIDCPRCGWVTVPEKNLPVKLPYLKDWKPLGTGQSPLAKVKEWVRVKCPKCQGKACRETDVSDTFLDSSWYFFRYPSVDRKDKPWGVRLTKKWLPVDMYIGGAEHSVLHLMYSRFLTMVFHDLDLLEFEEPYKKFRAHGLLISEGAKMSKSRGNVVIPDEYIKRYGADTLRMYLMFLGPFDKGGNFQDKGVVGVRRFLERVWKLTISNIKYQKAKIQIKNQKLETQLNKLIKKVTEDIESLKFNTAIAAMMEFVNELTANNQKKEAVASPAKRGERAVSRQLLAVFLKLLAPFAPHITEELWQELNRVEPLNSVSPKEGFNPSNSFIHLQPWPKYDSKLIEEDKVTMAIQVNGKLRGTLELPLEEAREKEKVIKLAKELDKIKKYLKEKKVKRAVFVPQKIVNFVV